MPATLWNPASYDRYQVERSRPFFDLVSRIDADSPRRVVDLGCGPGQLTETLARRWPDAEVVGFDSSPEILARARARDDAPANLSFDELDIGAWMPGASDDVVITNAALQWVPNHRELLPRWLEALPPGGWFAMQVPGNFGAASHRLLRETAAGPRWRDRLDGVLRHEDAVGEPDDYLATFLDAGYRTTAWETTYLQVLPGADPVLDWMRGTALRPVLSALGDDGPDFEAELGARLRDAYPAGPHGTVFPFRRTFAVGVRD
ncbi:trans-aconitate 2-methyltransferase [Leifsonia sp. NPDC058230]|uniref:trans-aconitate 2-methyltransferase n=1 Tax=Leifsonia sp. NPDC058230 TaxID=3346391 RepID=UPI0036DD20D0